MELIKMNEVQSFKRFPAVSCWIKHIVGGHYSIDDRMLYTIFGKVKRVRVIASIIDKREIINAPKDEDEGLLEEDDNSNLRIEFDLDDSTGKIRATLWRVNPEDYYDYMKGDIVDVVGLIRIYNEYKSLSPEIIKKVEEPNLILLRNAEILQRLKSGDLEEIPVTSGNLGTKDSEIDIDSLFENEEIIEDGDIKDKIFTIIKQYSSDGTGISFLELKKLVEISDAELKSNIRDLEMESRIYKSEENEENVYHTY